jgi:hypothetical protein
VLEQDGVKLRPPSLETTSCPGLGGLESLERGYTFAYHPVPVEPQEAGGEDRIQDAQLFQQRLEAWVQRFPRAVAREQFTLQQSDV